MRYDTVLKQINLCFVRVKVLARKQGIMHFVYYHERNAHIGTKETERFNIKGEFSAFREKAINNQTSV